MSRPRPLDWSDEDNAEQLAKWRADPERWAALHGGLLVTAC